MRTIGGLFLSAIGGISLYEGIRMINYIQYNGWGRCFLYLFFGVILLVVGVPLLRGGEKTRQRSNTNSKNSANTKKENNITGSKSRGSIEHYPSQKILTTYYNGKVYYDKSDYSAGSYDMAGNVYRSDGKRIGIVEEYDDGTSRLVLDRSFEWDWLVKQGNYVKPINKPAMGLMIARNYTSYIEPVVDRPELDWQCLAHIKKSSENQKANLIGSSAAFIVAVYENLIDGQGREFYLNAQEESDFIEKYGSGEYYSHYYRYKNIGLLTTIE